VHSSGCLLCLVMKAATRLLFRRPSPAGERYSTSWSKSATEVWTDQCLLFKFDIRSTAFCQHSCCQV